MPLASRSPLRLLLVDAANCLYRAFFAIPPLRNADGFPTNAVFGFATMLQKAVREEKADRVVVVFDASGPTFRDSLFRAYKAGRDAQAEDLSRQIPLARELVEAYRFPLLEVEGVEADDVIATLVARAPRDWKIVILSTDKDLMQLVSERVELVDTQRGRRFGPQEVERRFGVPPAKVLEVRALAGDPSDNIPGVRGIGPKGAAKLIREWGDLETLLAHVDEIGDRRLREALAGQEEQARLSRRVAELRRDVPLEIDLETLPPPEPDRERLRAVLERIGSRRLLAALESGEAEWGESARPAQVEAAARVRTEVLRRPEELARLAERLEQAEALWLLPVGEWERMPAELPAGVALAAGPSEAAYLPLAHRGLEAGGNLEPEAVAGFLERVLSRPKRSWGGLRTKRLLGVLQEWEIEPPVPAFDLELVAFLIDPAGPRRPADLARRWLGSELRPWEELAGRGAKARAAGELAVEEVARWSGETVAVVAALAPRMLERIEGDGLGELLREVELPLAAVLARMERAGVRIDEQALGEFSREVERELARIEGEIHALAGEPFLVSSPKQLQRILFEKLKLPALRRTKTGYSTDEAVLEQLAAHHELPARVLAHRRLAKLKGTYLDALPRLVCPETGRIHPTFHQTGAATGRLSASRPNVQNIPIRGEEGARIREAFVAAEGCLLVSADYSQVELRLLAHFSEDEALVEAFRADEDIHRRTASEVMGVPPEQVTPEQRSRAKAVNFGILYGLSPYGLAAQLGIATAEAEDLIRAYFARYPGVRRFLDRIVAEARERGFVRTLLGRRRYLPELRSRNRALKGAAERMAVNTVVQGTAADLIKKAMVEVDAALGRQGRRARLILQVHDELVLEAPQSEAAAIGELVRAKMEAVWPLRTRLRAEVGIGRSWREAH